MTGELIATAPRGHRRARSAAAVGGAVCLGLFVSAAGIVSLMSVT